MTYNASFQLGTADVLTLLYSYPNNADLLGPNGGEALADTIAHWFGLTLKRDGLAGKITAAVRITAAGVYVLDLRGDDGLTSSIDTIGSRLRQFLEQGRISARRADRFGRLTFAPAVIGLVMYVGPFKWDGWSSKWMRSVLPSRRLPRRLQ